MCSTATAELQIFDAPQFEEDVVKEERIYMRYIQTKAEDFNRIYSDIRLTRYNGYLNVANISE